MNVRSSFVTYNQSSESMEPQDGSFNYPSVTTKFFARFDPTAGNPWFDPPANTREPASFIVVTFVGMHIVWFPCWTALFVSEPRQSIKQIFEFPRIVQIGGCQAYCQGASVTIYREMVFTSRFPSINRTGTCFFAPFFACI